MMSSPLKQRETDGVFSEHAVNAIESAVSDYRNTLVEECNRLAAGERIDGKPPEVTAAMVNKAVTLLGFSGSIGNDKGASLALRISAAIAPVATGVLVSVLNLKDVMHLALIGAALLVTGVLIAMQHFMDYKK